LKRFDQKYPALGGDRAGAVGGVSRYMPRRSAEEVRYSSFLNDVKSSRVESVVLQGEMIYGVRKDKTQFKTYNPETDFTALIGALSKADVAIEGRPPKQPNFVAQLLLQLAPASS